MRPAQQERFWRKVDSSADCWVWTGHRTVQGYGRYAWATGPGVYVRTLAHRIAYELMVGPIPEGLVLDHLCRNRACVNPDHLEPVTDAVNILRGEAPTAKNARKVRCQRGHYFTPENTIRRRDGRECRTCRDLHARIHQARVRAQRFDPSIVVTAIPDEMDAWVSVPRATWEELVAPALDAAYGGPS